MSIKAPGSRIGSSVKMKSLKVGAHRQRRSMLFSLNLTPMIDMFTILVVFLLITFSATGEILLQQEDIQLPKAYSGRALERYPMIGISANVVIFEGIEVIKTAAVNEKNFPDLKLPELSKILKAAHDSYQSNHPMPADPEKAKKWLDESKQVVIQADEEVPFEVIRLVMTTAAIEGYSSINFAVQKKAKEGAEQPVG
jgi:biopolymer transport protein ExbD